MARFAPATTGTATGAAPRGYDPAYGGVPQVPNLIDIYGQSIGANLNALPLLTALGTSVSGATEQELLNNLRMALPGYDASVGKSMGNIGALQRGEIPTDVSNLLKQQAAERGIATGLYSSPNANAALLSALGQTSLGLQSEGEKQMSALVGRTPQAQPFDISRMLLSPTDLYESQLLANMYRAAPVPKSAAQQLISDQMAGYERGRANVPPAYSFGSGGGGGLPALTPAPRWNPVNETIGGHGPAGEMFGGVFYPEGKYPGQSTAIPTANLAAGGGDMAGMEWDPEMGSYWNRFTNTYMPIEEGSDSEFAGGAEGYDTGAGDYYDYSF